MKGFYGELGVRGLFLSVLMLHVNTTHNYVMMQAPKVRVGWATNAVNQRCVASEICGKDGIKQDDICSMLIAKILDNPPVQVRIPVFFGELPSPKVRIYHPHLGNKQGNNEGGWVSYGDYVY